MQVKIISPAMAVARSYWVENVLPGVPGAGYRARACVTVSPDFSDELNDEH